MAARKNFESGDLVWAKMKGYSPWPGRIVLPPADQKSKKYHHYVFFFGSNNHAWIPDDYIELHSEKIVEKYKRRKGAVFHVALRTIVDYAKGSIPSGLPILTPKSYGERPSSPPIDLIYKSTFIREKEIEPTKKIGFLGLSKVGQAIVRNLCHSGHSLIIWNQKPDIADRLAEKFKLQIAKTPADVIRAANIIFSYMPDADAAKDLIFEKCNIFKEMEHSDVAGKGYVEMTSMDPKSLILLATEIRMKGGHYLEAPLSDSRKEADEGTFLIKAAGDKALYDDCKSCFDAISKTHTFISAEVEMAAEYNIVENMLMGTVCAAAAESFSLAKKIGLNGNDFLKIFKDTDLYSPVLYEKLMAMEKTDYVTDIPLKQVQDKFELGLALGDEISQRTTLFATANEMYKHCSAMKKEDLDVSAIFEGTK